MNTCSLLKCVLSIYYKEISSNWLKWTSKLQIVCYWSHVHSNRCCQSKGRIWVDLGSFLTSLKIDSNKEESTFFNGQGQSKKRGTMFVADINNKSFLHQFQFPYSFVNHHLACFCVKLLKKVVTSALLWNKLLLNIQPSQKMTCNILEVLKSSFICP